MLKNTLTRISGAEVSVGSSGSRENIDLVKNKTSICGVIKVNYVPPSPQLEKILFKIECGCIGKVVWILLAGNLAEIVICEALHLPRLKPCDCC